MFSGEKSINDLKAHSKEPTHVTENINQAPDSLLCIQPLSSGLKIQEYVKHPVMVTMQEKGSPSWTHDPSSEHYLH